MSEGYKEIIEEISKNAEQVVSKYRDLEYKFNELSKQNESLTEELELVKNTKENIEVKFEKLKSAKVFEHTNSDVKETKSRINKLVKEIDRCIALLNVD